MLYSRKESRVDAKYISNDILVLLGFYDNKKRNENEMKTSKYIEKHLPALNDGWNHYSIEIAMVGVVLLPHDQPINYLIAMVTERK